MGDRWRRDWEGRKEGRRKGPKIGPMPQRYKLRVLVLSVTQADIRLKFMRLNNFKSVPKCSNLTTRS